MSDDAEVAEESWGDWVRRVFPTAGLGVAGLFVVALWAPAAATLIRDEWPIGTWGDSFAPVAALLNLAALLAAVHAVGLQRAELRLQREENVKVRLEMQLQRAEQSRQAEIQERGIKLAEAQYNLDSDKFRVEEGYTLRRDRRAEREAEEQGKRDRLARVQLQTDLAALRCQQINAVFRSLELMIKVDERDSKKMLLHKNRLASLASKAARLEDDMAGLMEALRDPASPDDHGPVEPPPATDKPE